MITKQNKNSIRKIKYTLKEKVKSIKRNARKFKMIVHSNSKNKSKSTFQKSKTKTNTNNKHKLMKGGDDDDNKKLNQPLYKLTTI